MKLIIIGIQGAGKSTQGNKNTSIHGKNCNNKTMIITNNKNIMMVVVLIIVLVLND